MESPERQPGGERVPGEWRYWVYRVAAALVPRVPYAVVGPLAMAVGLTMWAVSPAARRRVHESLTHIPPLAGDSQARAAAVRGVFCHLALNYVDLFRAHRLGDAALHQSWRLEGTEHYEAARAAGRGVILITGHLGNFDHAAARLGLFGTPITIPVERLKPERLFALVCRLRTHHGVRTVPADSKEGLRALVAALRRGEAVLLTVDRDVLGTGAVVPFFGSPARLPTGAALLARRSGAPLLWAGGFRDGLWRSRGGFVPVALSPGDDSPAGLPRDLSTQAAPDARAYERRSLTRMLVPIARELERQVASRPEQWVAALARIWSDPCPSAGEASTHHAPGDASGLSP